MSVWVRVQIQTMAPTLTTQPSVYCEWKVQVPKAFCSEKDIVICAHLKISKVLMQTDFKSSTNWFGRNEGNRLTSQGFEFSHQCSLLRLLSTSIHPHDNPCASIPTAALSAVTAVEQLLSSGQEGGRWWFSASKGGRTLPNAHKRKEGQLHPLCSDTQLCSRLYITKITSQGSLSLCMETLLQFKDCCIKTARLVGPRQSSGVTPRQRMGGLIQPLW